MDAFYRSLQLLNRVALSFYYKEIEVRGEETVPREGPLLVLANHQISLVDPVLLAHVVPRRIYFLAKETLFKIPVLSAVMRLLGMIPVHRKQDEGYAKEKNADVYGAVAKVLDRGCAVGIFPEGISHDEPMLGEFRHGAARIALEAEARAGFTGTMRVQLVGIHIEESRLFRGRVLVTVAPPMTLESMKEAYARDPREAIATLTARFREEMARLVLEAEDHEDIVLAGLIESLDLLEVKTPGLTGALARKQYILSEYRRLQVEHPSQIFVIRELLLVYRDALELRGMPVATEAERRSWIGRIMVQSAQVTAAAPLIALGVTVNGAPFLLVRGVASALTWLQGRGEDVRASLGIMLGTPVFLVWYAALAWYATVRLDPWIWLPLVGAAPGCGVLALGVLGEWKALLRRTLLMVTSLGSSGPERSIERLRALLRQKIIGLYGSSTPETPTGPVA